MVDRIASFVQTNKMINNNLTVQSKYADGQIQLSSGVKSQNYQGVAKESATILNLESEYQRLSTQTDNAQTALDRTESMFDAYGSMLSIGQSFLSDLRQAIDGSATASQVQNIAQNNLEHTASILNTTVAGRYIFGGSITKSQPVDITAYGGATPPSAADTSYYQGDSFIQSVEVSNNFTIDYGVTADDPAVEKIMRAYDLVRTSPANQAALTEALQLMETGLDELAVSKANIAQNSNIIESRITDNKSQLTLIDEQISGLKDVDLAEVSLRLKEYEAQLQASYAVTTTLLKLTVTDYL